MNAVPPIHPQLPPLVPDNQPARNTPSVQDLLFDVDQVPIEATLGSNGNISSHGATDDGYKRSPPARACGEALKGGAEGSGRLEHDVVENAQEGAVVFENSVFGVQVDDGDIVRRAVVG